MANKSDHSKKFDLNQIVGGIKSLIHLDSGTPDVEAGDALGVKIAKISTILQTLSQRHHDLSKELAEAAKQLSQVNNLLNSAFKDINTLREEVHGDGASKSRKVKKISKTPKFSKKKKAH